MRNVMLLLVGLCLLSACDKRYEEGPCISLIKAENRICGQWDLAKAYVQNNPVEGANADTLSAYGFSFFMNSGKALFLSLSNESDTTVAECLVRTNERLTNLSFSLQTVSGYEQDIAPLFRIIPALEQDQTWTITQLKRDEMWLQTNLQECPYELHFKLRFDYQNL